MEWNKQFLNKQLFEPVKQWLDRHGITCPDVWPTLAWFNRVLSQLQPVLINANDQRVRFVDQATQFPHFEDGYEQRIYLKGEVQTRLENWHDFFNAFIWMRFPKIKTLVNNLHYQEFLCQHQRGKAKQRTMLQNQLAHFDECGIIVLSKSETLLELIRTHRWHDLFWRNRARLEAEMSFEFFGHALYEKALNPYIGFTGKAVLIHTNNFDNGDQKTADYIKNNVNNIKAILSPLPILGIPGWSDDNFQECFYLENNDYFR